MAYRETEKGRAHKAAQRENIIASALDVIARQGLAGMTNNAVAKRAGISNGSIFNYFADMGELAAHIESAVMVRDTGAMMAAAKAADSPARALAAGISALFDRLAGNGYSREMAGRAGYRMGVVKQLTHLIGPASGLSGSEARLAAQAALGVICGLARGDGPAGKRASMAVLFSLRGIGVKEKAIG